MALRETGLDDTSIALGDTRGRQSATQASAARHVPDAGHRQPG
jgi:hypothetical protein